MDSKEFWRKFKELADRQKEDHRKQDLTTIMSMKFVEVNAINFITFKFDEDMPQEDINIKYQKVKGLLQKYNLTADFDMEGMMGVGYDARFLKELDSLLPIESVELNILMRKK